MSDYICPECNGGFPAIGEGLTGQVKECPWCGQELDGSYEYEPRVQTISRTESDDSGEVTMIDKLFGGPE